MWTFVFVVFLWTNVCEADGRGNSTQILFMRLTIDKLAAGNVSDLLTTFVGNASLQVDDLRKTTTCLTDSGGTTCSCEAGHRWSDSTCLSERCCEQQSCTFKSASHMCVHNRTVSLTGSLKLKGQNHTDCLSDWQTDRFQLCNDTLTNKMKSVFSTLRGFDSLVITKYSVGSVVASFEMSIANRLHPQDLVNKVLNLGGELQAIVAMETEGVVWLTLPSRPVCSGRQAVLQCSSHGDGLQTAPTLKLRRQDGVLDVTNGTEATVTRQEAGTKITLRNISLQWEGEYLCEYRQSVEDNYTIIHRARGVMGVVVLPDIFISSEPQFPRCHGSNDLLLVKIRCEAASRPEYTVTWSSPSSSISLMQLTSADGVHLAETLVSCDTDELPKISCTFENSCSRQRTASHTVHRIREDSLFCAAEGDWSDTLAGFSSILKCQDGTTGLRSRKCRNGSEATWEPEVSGCVNNQVQDVLQKADVVDVGLGSVEQNAAVVFSALSNVTSDSQAIDSQANLNASLHVLVALSRVARLQPNESMAEDFLQASSNLLDESLSRWLVTEDGGASLAERYLSSVEQIIKVSDVSRVGRKAYVEAAAAVCQPSGCSSQVLNATVQVRLAAGTVKTAAFQRLQDYLPKRAGVDPNSAVVSATTNSSLPADFQVTISFQLVKPRPRHVLLQCVWWDNGTRAWSPRGCRWEGPSDESTCVCSHLSSFAILMSRRPEEVPALSRITDAGLSVSVAALLLAVLLQLLVWRSVVTSSSLYLRHAAHLNISLCLLLADVCFLASSRPPSLSGAWCRTLAVLKHFLYLAAFFWMLCLSASLLHHAVFLFHQVSRKTYLRCSLALGYLCPLLIVAAALLANQGAAEGSYYSAETCWLVYRGLLSGSIHSFLLPVGVVVMFNTVSMLVVVVKLLSQQADAEKQAAIGAVRAVLLLTPVFGLTWILGFAVMVVDITSGGVALVVNYAFVLLNSFQGLFVLVTTCLADKQVREAVKKRLKPEAEKVKTSSSTVSVSS